MTVAEHKSKWTYPQMRDVCNFIGGSQPAKSEFVFERREGYIRLIQIRDYKSDKNTTYIPLDKARRFCTKDDIMIGRYGPPLFQILRGLEGAYNVALMKAEPKNTAILNTEYLYYFLRNQKLFDYVVFNSERTAGQDGVKKELLETYKIPLPPLEEQKRIAAILDKADAIRRARKEAIALTEELLRSTFLDMFGDPVTNPKGWEVVKLEKILGEPFQNGAYFPKDKYSNGNNSIEMIHMSDAFYGVALPGNLKRVLASKKEIGQYGLTEGDVLINRRSLNYEGSAKPCLIPNLKEPLIFESSLIRVRVNRDIIDPIFFYSYMLQPRARAAFVFPYVTKSTISGINQTGLKQVKLTVPPIELQLQYKQFYNQVTCTTIKHENSLERINNLFNSLLQKAFRGEL